MKLNQFIWNNYKETARGKEAIQLFTDGSTTDIISRFGGNLSIGTEETVDFIDDLCSYASKPALPDTLSSENAESFFREISLNGITLTHKDGEFEIIDPKKIDLLQLIPIISTWLYYNYPDFYKPYFFVHKFSLLRKIADTFEIRLPQVPLKKYRNSDCSTTINFVRHFLNFKSSIRFLQLSSVRFCTTLLQII